MKKLLLVAVILAVAYYFNRPPAEHSDSSRESAAVEAGFGADGSTALDEAFANRASGIQVNGIGTVTRILDDDEDGDRHQRFIVQLGSGQTLLVAHNIDVAPRIGSLSIGDAVEFRGEYEWNDQGGVLHWTHHDPQGQHEAGWLKHRGHTYR